MGSFSFYSRIGDILNLSKFRYRISKSTPTYQPVVSTKCEWGIWTNAIVLGHIEFPNNSNIWTSDDGSSQAPFSIGEDSKFWTRPASNYTQFHWIKDTRENSTSSTLALVSATYDDPNNRRKNYSDKSLQEYVACSIDARWFASEIFLSPTTSTDVYSNVTNNLKDVLQLKDKIPLTKYGISQSPLDVDPEWIAYLNPNLAADNNAISYAGTAMAKLIYPTMAKEFPSAAEVSHIISRTDADGLSRSRSVSWLGRPYVSKNDFYNRDFIYWFNKSSVPSQPADCYVIKMEIDRYAYGFALRGQFSQFALITFSIYIGVVCIHVGYLIYTRVIGRYRGGCCWEYPGELMALAMNSSPSDRLLGAGAGMLWYDARWEHLIRVRSMKDDKLELCFVKDDKEQGQMLEVGKKYL
jgi:hypothetical protein